MRNAKHDHLIYCIVTSDCTYRLIGNKRRLYRRPVGSSRWLLRQLLLSNPQCQCGWGDRWRCAGGDHLTSRGTGSQSGEEQLVWLWCGGVGRHQDCSGQGQGWWLLQQALGVLWLKGKKWYLRYMFNVRKIFGQLHC